MDTIGADEEIFTHGGELGACLIHKVRFHAAGLLAKCYEPMVEMDRSGRQAFEDGAMEERL
jgi:hypothetical protein